MRTDNSDDKKRYLSSKKISFPSRYDDHHTLTRLNEKNRTERERNIKKDSKENGERRSYEKGLNADAFSSKINTNSCQNIHNKKNYHTPKKYDKRNDSIK
jgi:hypothetical protein